MSNKHTVNEVGILCKLAINLRFEHDKMFSANAMQTITDMTANVTQGISKLDMDDIGRRLGTSTVFELGIAVGSSSITPDTAWLNTVIGILTKYWRSLSSTDTKIEVAISCRWEELMNEGMGGYPGGNELHSCTIVHTVTVADFKSHAISSPMWLDLIASDLSKIGSTDKYFLEVTKVVRKDN